MYSAVLWSPTQIVQTQESQAVTLKKIIDWRQKLDYSNNSEINQDFLKTLKKINRTELPLSERIELMEILFPVSETILSKITYKNGSFGYPSSKKHQKLSNYIQLILLEIAIAYKIIIKAITLDKKLISKHLGKLLPDACFRAINALSCFLIERYQQYFSEPDTIWLEINQIYLLSEKLGIIDVPIEDNQSIIDQYKRISMIRIADPYRLMHNEITKLNQMIIQWVDYCSIETIAGKDLTISHVVDLSRDRAPGSILAVFNKVPEEARVFNLGQLKIHIERLLREETQTETTGIESLNSRLKKDMLLRLKKQFSYPGEHREERNPSSNKIRMIAGISACHYFISGKKEFRPDTEIQKFIQNKNIPPDKSGVKNTAALSIVPLGQESEFLDKKARISDLQKINPFISEDMLMTDNWEQIYSSSVISANIKSNTFTNNESHIEELWQQRNKHHGGMLLQKNNHTGQSLSVGMLVAYRTDTLQDAISDEKYSLAVIRWLRFNLKKGMAIGLMKLSGKYQAIAVQATAGIGKGGNYNQGLINTTDSWHEGYCTLLLPSGIYDTDTVLNIWHEEKIVQAKIIHKIMTTNAIMLVKCLAMK